MSTHQGLILVVDDDEPNRDMLSRRLRKRGYEVDVAEDGMRALELIGRRPFDLVVLDVMMPGINGLEVLETLRRGLGPTDLPVIMATAKDQSEDVVRALELGANDYITKPLDFAVVMARIQTQLALKRAVDEVVRLERGLAERNRLLESAHHRITRDLRAAARVQTALLPKASTSLSGASFAWIYRPCDELAGDALHVLPFDDHRAALYVLDVSGHGVASALLSVSIVHALSAPSDPSSLLVREGGVPAAPREVADELNRRFPFDMDTEQFFTLLYGVLDVEAGEFRYVSAGHPGPLVLPADGEPRMLDSTGPPIGLFRRPYQEQSVRLAPGDRLVLYSDGVPEAVDARGDAFGVPRMLEALRRRDGALADGLGSLRDEVEAWCGAAGPRDDISLLAFEFAPLAGAQAAAAPEVDATTAGPRRI